MRTSEKVVLDAALEYAGRGLPVFPVHFPTEDGCSCGKPKSPKCSPGKHPATPNGHQDATLSKEQIVKWFGQRYKGYNIGAVCGVGYLCLDVDPKNGGLESFEELVQNNEPLPHTWVEETGENRAGERGRHYWFLLPRNLKDDAKITRKINLPGYTGLDLLGKGYAIVAPSLHASGVQYESLTGVDEVTEIPPWLLDLMLTTPEIDHDFTNLEGRYPTGIRPGPEIRAFLREGNIPAGGQQPMVVKAARALWGLWFDVEDATELIWQAIQKCDWSNEPWTREQINYHVADTYKSAPKDMNVRADLPYTDWGNALRLAEFSRGNLKYCPHTKTWYNYDTTCWREDHTLSVFRLVTGVSLKEQARAAFIEDADRATPIRKNAVALQQVSRASSCVAAAQALEEFVITPEEFDTHKFLLNCQNCVVDLRNGNTRGQKREDFITYSTNAAYYEERRSELWEDALGTALDRDEDLINYLQLVLGHSLFGISYEQAFYYLHGPGGTGKTTILEAVSHTLGSYAGVADPETFMQSPNANPGGTRADLAALRGKRFVLSTEIQVHSKFSTATVNRLTGNDTITVRMPYAKGMLTFKPEWTLFFAANHFPSVTASKRDGFWRRTKVIPFEHQLTRFEMNPVLPHLLAKRENKEGILAWLIQGAQRWWSDYGSQMKHMPTPQVVSAEVEHQQEESDPLLPFYKELQMGEGRTCTKNDLHQYYLGWAQREGIKQPWTSVRLSRHLKGTLGLADARSKDATWIWLGVSIPGVTKR